MSDWEPTEDEMVSAIRNAKGDSPANVVGKVYNRKLLEHIERKAIEHKATGNMYHHGEGESSWLYEILEDWDAWQEIKQEVME